ncbi:hypothetical protein [Nocardioides yefusunii]|uniref:Uncharacterized protein n=1 Tax=Nocardioides yefusunii TaxID=2500546 RepID=A0ABW1R3L6_9ACTN|nr:hypothetical protein [Nocardioides yefusunii]
MSRRAAGTKRWNRIRKRWESWTGKRWAPAAYSNEMSLLRQPHDPAKGPVFTPEQRQYLLDRVVAQESLKGWDAVHRTAHTVTLRGPAAGPSLLGLLTLGTLALLAPDARRPRRKLLGIDEQGHVWIREA